jgi:Holliday junction resolvase RusA-like endonuclease
MNFKSDQIKNFQILEPDTRFKKVRPDKKAEIALRLELERLQEKVKIKAKTPIAPKTQLEGITTIHIKPLSQNRAWLGKRFKSKDYKKYEPLVMGLLPAGSVPGGQLKISYVFGFSRTSCDIDNPVKICTDLLQKKYGFNDRDIFEMNIRKVPVAKGNEYFSFLIEKL